jgi:cell division protein FtsZ
MSGRGSRYGTGTGKGENRALDAAQKAVASPLLDETSRRRAAFDQLHRRRRSLIHEVEEAARIVQEAAHERRTSSSVPPRSGFDEVR